MNIFSTLKIDDENSLKHHPLDRSRLDPLSIIPHQFGVTTTSLDGVSVFQIETQTF
jgi:hypothetical protein